MWRVAVLLVVVAAAVVFVQCFLCMYVGEGLLRWGAAAQPSEPFKMNLSRSPRVARVLALGCFGSFASFRLVWFICLLLLLWSMVYMLAQFHVMPVRLKPFWTEALCLTRLRHCNFSSSSTASSSSSISANLVEVSGPRYRKPRLLLVEQLLQNNWIIWIYDRTSIIKGIISSAAPGLSNRRATVEGRKSNEFVALPLYSRYIYHRIVLIMS